MKELTAIIHIHSTYSDGSETPTEIVKIAAKSGVDIIMLTEHNIYPGGFDGYYTHDNSKVLLLTGEEIHDQNRQPQKNHMLALGIDRDFSRFAEKPQDLINQLDKANALSFIAHAYDPGLPMIGEGDYSWVDWDIEGFTGFEIWNNLSEFKVRAKNIWQIGLFALFPEFMAYEPPIQIREKWDAYLKKGEKMAALGGADAHQIIKHIGPFTKIVFPYSYHFKTIRNYLLVPSALTGNVENDRKMIINTLREGHLFIANDMVKPASGFAFYLNYRDQRTEMGDNAEFKTGQKIIVKLPYPAECRLICNGDMLDARHIDSEYSWEVKKPGAYRLECYRRFLGKKRGWIFSNPIYITPSP